MNKIEILIDALPDTPEAIAELLKEEGVTGNHASYSCPLANHFKSRGVSTYVNASSIGSGSDSVPNSAHIAKFVQRFDSGEFPELEAK